MVRLEMARFGFSWVWLGLFWLCSFWFVFRSLFEKKAGKIRAGKKNIRGKYLAGKRPSEEKIGVEMTYRGKIGGEKTHGEKT